MGEEEVCMPLTSDGVVKDQSPSRTEHKRDSEWVGDQTEDEPSTKKLAVEAINDTELESCANKLVKEASNDDICSEVSNPHLSPRDNDGSFHTISSQPPNELVSNNNPVGSSENSSTCSGNSSSEGTLSDEEQSLNDASGAESTSHFVLEIPQHVSSSGVRKITFRFSKPKEENQEIDNQCASDGVSDSLYNVPQWPYSAPVNNNAEISTSMKMVDERSKPFSYHSNRELKMSKKVLSEIYPTNVKKLLATGILDGARVKYIYAPSERELPGIIKGGGYLCGCVLCNFSMILSAFEFEMHAGAKTRHPNNHIYLENGRPIYNIIQELKNAPLDEVDEVMRSVAGSSLNNESFLDWKASLERDSVTVKAERSDHAMVPRMYHSTTSGHVRKDNAGFTSYPPIFPVRKHSYMPEVSKGRKRVAKKANFHASPVPQQRKTAAGGIRKRDNDLHRLLFMPDGLPDRTELAYYSKGQRILGGYKQGNGIVCSCCHTEISPSQFEAHAGWSARRQPYRNIYTSSGLTLHDIALLLANGQNLAASSSDDMCAVCGDGSDLIICDGCPRAFHVDCLNLQSAPEGDWHCPYCVDKLCLGRKSTGDLSCSGRPFVIRLTRVVKSPESETGGCVVCRANDFSVAKFDERTVMLCDQCEKEYHVGCLRSSGLCDLKELPKDKWFCRDECKSIHVGLQNLVLAGVQTIPASVSTAIKRRNLVSEFSDGAVDDVQWRILSGKSRYPDHLPVLSRATAIFRECFDPIVATSGRDLIPVMVYGRNISGQEFGGMYCVVLIVKSVVVSAGLLRIFGQEVAELPIVATSRENQGKGYFLALFSCIERLLCSLNVETLVLPAAGDAESIWTNRLGFRKMNDERLSKYTRDFQLTSFKGTSMLEKEVQPIEEEEEED